jgi:hypothetical protein
MTVDASDEIKQASVVMPKLAAKQGRIRSNAYCGEGKKGGYVVFMYMQLLKKDMVRDLQLSVHKNSFLVDLANG